MAAARIQVEGAKELRRAFRRAQIEVKNELKVTHKEAAELVEKAAKVEVPVRSGTLKSTIRSSGTQTKAIVRAGRASVPYAGVIHFGWPGHNISPQPFVYEALDKRRSEVIKTYEDRVAKITRRVTGA